MKRLLYEVSNRVTRWLSFAVYHAESLTQWLGESDAVSERETTPIPLVEVSEDRGEIRPRRTEETATKTANETENILTTIATETFLDRCFGRESWR